MGGNDDGTLTEATFICPIPVVDLERARGFYIDVLGPAVRR